MDGFSYTNIFETKGIEYLVIIAFLLLIIPFWYLLNRKKTAPETAYSLSDLIPGFKIPMGIFFSKQHSWVYLESSGIARTGIDDFLVRVTGKLQLNITRKEGDKVRKGDLIAEAFSNGKKLRIFTPVSGTVSEVNSLLSGEKLINDPYNESWICKLVPANWKAETRSYFLAEETRRWLNSEVVRFRDLVAAFMARENALPVLQDGGELSGYPLSELPDEAWAAFEKSFLTLEAGNE